MGPKFAETFNSLFVYANRKIDRKFVLLDRKYVDMNGSKFGKTLKTDFFRFKFHAKIMHI